MCFTQEVGAALPYNTARRILGRSETVKQDQCEIGGAIDSARSLLGTSHSRRMGPSTSTN